MESKFLSEEQSDEGGNLNGGLERVDGIEPTSSAWKAAALPLCYTRAIISITICQKILETALFKIFCLYMQVAE